MADEAARRATELGITNAKFEVLGSGPCVGWWVGERSRLQKCSSDGITNAKCEVLGHGVFMVG